MSVISDAIAAMKEVMLFAEKIYRAGTLLSELSSEIRVHDKRLIRFETLVEVAKYQSNQPKIESN